MKNQPVRVQSCPLIPRNGALIPLVLCALCLGLPGYAQHSHITTFSIASAGARAGQGTFAYGINSQGAITGFYLDGNYVYHGFLRSSAGSVTTFEAPGSGADSGSYQGTYSLAIDSEGTIAGFYRDANYVHHGFVRSPDGGFTNLEAPGAGMKAYQGTFAYGINTDGDVAGFYLDVNDVYHGFVRSPAGSFTTFEAPGAGSALYSDEGTLPGLFSDVNQPAEIAGFYLDGNDVYHGFLRNPDGDFSTFEAPGASMAAGSYHGTLSESINDSDQVTGYYIDASNVNHGFLRNPDGAFAAFEAPNAGTGSGQGTIAENNNDSGTITGYCIDSSNVDFAFVRSADGAFTLFQAPGAGTHSGQGTIPQGINGSGAITGYYLDASSVSHGFLWTP
jgi:hypothetical protein